MSKKVIAVIAVGLVLVVAIGVTATVIYKNQSDTEKITVGENQKIIYAYVSSIEGNEMTYMEVDESVVTAMQERTGQSAKTDEGDAAKSQSTQEPASDAEQSQDTQEFSDADKEQMSQNGERGGATREKMQDGEMPTGEMPTEMASEGTTGENPSGMKMQMGTETTSTLIPVGTSVHTSAGTTTTFSRLASGDLLELLVEENAAGEEVIVEIWMLQ